MVDREGSRRHVIMTSVGVFLWVPVDDEVPRAIHTQRVFFLGLIIPLYVSPNGFPPSEFCLAKFQQKFVKMLNHELQKDIMNYSH